MGKKKEVKVEVKKEIKEEKKKTKSPLIFIICGVIVIAIGILIAYLVSPYNLTLKGSKEVTISLDDDYEDKGAVVKRFIFVANKDIEVEGSVNTEKIGDYKITYKWNGMSVTRTIHVVLGKGTINGPSYNITKGKEVLILDVNSEKDVFKDIYFYDSKNNIIEKENVKVKDDIDINNLGKYEVKYTICDSNNICSEATRKVEVKDLTAPVITLNRGNLKIPVGNTYNEYGAEAYDNYDKNLGDIKIESNVDMSKEGVYQVKYSICDSSNNCSEKIRKVTTFIQATPKPSTVIDGNFTSHPSIEGTMPSTLSLNSSKKTGTIVINKCEGTDTISGTYSVSGSTLTLKLSRAIDPGQPSVLKFTIIDNNTLKLETNVTACAPYQYEKYTKD